MSSTSTLRSPPRSGDDVASFRVDAGAERVIARSFSLERANAPDVAGALGDGDRAARVEQVERVRRLQHLLVGRQRELARHHQRRMACIAEEGPGALDDVAGGTLVLAPGAARYDDRPADEEPAPSVDGTEGGGGAGGGGGFGRGGGGACNSISFVSPRTPEPSWLAG